MPPTALPDADRLTPRVVFFGPPNAGKSSLIRSFLHAVAAADEHSAVEFAEGPGGLKRELVPHRIRFPNPDDDVVVCDSDGRAADDLLARPGTLARGALASAVRSADTLVLVVDAAASADEVDATFRAFGRFLDRLEDRRTFGRDAGGLPVFLTLTKCDALFRPGDAPGDWLARIEARKREVSDRFEDYFGDDVEDSPDYLAFGSLDTRLAATATIVPATPAFLAYADADGSFGVSNLADEVLPAARAYRDRLLRTRRRLRATVAGVGGVVGLMLAGLVGLAAAGFVAEDPLAARVRAYRVAEGSPAVRLSDRNFARYRGELLAVRESPRFDALPSDLRAFVDDRLREFAAYREYRAKFRPPRLGPADVRTRDELNRLTAALAGELTPPTDYAAAWADTEAVRLRAKWQTDAALVSEAEGQLNDWYRGLIRRANELLLTGEPPSAAWRGKVAAAVAAESNPPFRPSEKVPGSPTVPVRRGAALTYAPAFEFDQIDQARRDWADARDRLLALRDLCDALGLTTGPGSPTAVLDLPEPGAGVDSLSLAAARLKALAEAFPKQPLQHPEWSLDNFPDPSRKWLEPRLRVAFDAGVRHVRGLILARLGQDSRDDWRRLAAGFLTEPPLRDWGLFLGMLRRWAEPTSPAADPVRELAAFLETDRFDLKPRAFDLTIPDDLIGERLIPAGKLVLRHTPAGGSPVEAAFRADGDGRRDRPLTAYRFVPEGDGPPASFVYRPGDGFTAELPLRAGTREYRLVWNAPRSTVYRFDALAQPPVLEKVGPIPAPERVPGVRLTAEPPDGWPAVPVLLPSVKPAGP